ncbi:MAG: hypothetical protein NTZ56_23390 [Acidobacteria bacterium]|nr:hypothetical protein [Acidobacteriota bacterium]
MNARHLTVRNVPEDLAVALDFERQRRGKSLNQTVVDLLTQALGVKGKRRNGLAHLAGGWSEAEFEEFNKNTASFSEPDPELWK